MDVKPKIETDFEAKSDDLNRGMTIWISLSKLKWKMKILKNTIASFANHWNFLQIMSNMCLRRTTNLAWIIPFRVGKGSQNWVSRIRFCIWLTVTSWNQYRRNKLKSVHFKKAVVRISFLSKLWYFQYKTKQKVPQFWKKRDSRHCLLKMNGL